MFPFPFHTTSQHSFFLQNSLLLEGFKGPQEMAGAFIAHRVPFEVQLVVILGVPPGSGGDDLRHDPALVPLCVGLVRHLLGNLLLLLVVEVDAAAVVGAGVGSLPVQCCWIMHAVEELEELAVGDALGVVEDL